MSDSKENRPYAELAVRISDGRRRLGLSQASLAAELGLKQQAVSRWEAGTHRPSVDQLPALSMLIGEDSADLMTLAGFGQPVTMALSALFPVDALAPEVFERFVEALISELHPDASVNILGGRGHAQKGADVIARLQNGGIWSFQCKRVERFGVADVEKAIAAHALEADQKFLVLSKIANPSTIEAVAAHSDWTLWDKSVLTRKVRSLPMNAQERLVDIFFRGQRMALLGRNEPGPWVSFDEYFAPFEGRSAVFTHDWPLVGRSAELNDIVNVLQNDNEHFALLLGPGGIGKTRILKEAVSRFSHNNPGTKIHFLSTSQEPTPASLSALGGGDKLLIVDDAHDRDGLNLLIEYTVNNRNRAKLLIASRPYAEQRIRNELALYRITDPTSVTLSRLDKATLRELVINVLNEFGGNPDWADPIMDAASDSPLVAAMAARVVANGGLAPELARGESNLRRHILARFTGVITGELGAPADAPLLRAVLEVLALIQPFHIDDRRIADLVETAHAGIAAGDVTRALKLLLDGGVIYKRGALYRLMPDLLGDFLVEEACIGADGALAEFAINVANHVEADRLNQVLVNLGRTDWRLADGNPSKSSLLEPIWKSLRTIDNKFDPRIAAVEGVAYYQPAQALDFVQAQIDEGRILRQFSTILKRVALSPEHRNEALGLLWDLGQDDDRETNPYPEHAIRVLADLIEYTPYKPVSFNADVSEFAFSLLDRSDVWDRKHTPFDILKPLLSGEGTETSSSGRTISFRPFFINYDVVEGLRSKLIDRILGLLESENPKAAFSAAMMIGEAVRSPIGLLNSQVPDDLEQKYEEEFSGTIARVDALLSKGSLAPTTIIALIRSLVWHAQYGSGRLHDQVIDLFQKLPGDLDFRFYAALTDEADWSFVGQVPFEEWDDDEKNWRPDFTSELLSAFPDAAVLCDELIKRLNATAVSNRSTVPAVNTIAALVYAEPEIGTEIIERSLNDPETPLRKYLGVAVGENFERHPQHGRDLISRLLKSPAPHIRRGGASGLFALRRRHEEDDLAIMRAGLSSTDAVVVSTSISALRTWRDLSFSEAVSLLARVDVGESEELMEGVATVLSYRYRTELDQMHGEEAVAILKRMERQPSLKGHGIGELLRGLSRQHGLAVAQFMLNRADIALARKDDNLCGLFDFDRDRNALGLERSPEISLILQRAWSWLRSYDNIWPGGHYSVSSTLAKMLDIGSAPVVDFLDGMLDRATVGDLEWIGRILRDAHPSFAIEQHRFVERYLNRCKAVEPELVGHAVDNILAAAMSGSWSGIVGEPMPRDVQARDRAAGILSSMSRLSPSHRLYRAILERAERNIERTRAEAAALDEEE